MSANYYNLLGGPFTQDWSNTGLITTNDDWSGVPSVVGYRGDELTGSTGTDPQTIVAEGTGVIDVNANQTNPTTFNTGGVAEFEITNPVVALNGSGTADAPFLLIYLDTTGVETIGVSYNLRDVDASTDDAVQQVALQYRVGTTGDFINIPAGYVADASEPNSALRVTPVSVTLPAAAENQAQVQLRIITTNANGNDESIGVDDIAIAGTPIDGGGGDTPIVSIAATDATAAEASQDSGTFTITRTGNTSEALTVNYTVAGQAINGEDYTPTLDGTVAIAAGADSAEITITPVDDSDVEGNETVTLTLEDTDNYDLGSPNSATVAIADNDVELTPIYEIQGAAQTSPLAGNSVTTSGIVTAVDSNGFYLQDPTGDGEIATSDGIFVFTSSAPGVRSGDQVQVGGTVSEFTPGGASTGNLSTTQIIASSGGITTLASGVPLPSSVVLGVDRTPPTEVIDNDQNTQYNTLEQGDYEPAEDGIDFYESLEGMRVTVNAARAVSPTNQFGEIFTVANNGAGATGLSQRGTINISPNDFNPERIQIDDDSTVSPQSIPLVDVGAQLGDVTGVVSYNFGNFEVIPTETFTPSDSALQPENSNLTPGESQLTVASYNVLNLDPNDADGDTDIGDGRFEAIASQIANNLNAPDILGLQEVQDNDGSVNSTTTAADDTLQLLIDEIAAAGGPTYAFIDNPFIGDDTNGGEPGGNIRTAFLYNPDRVDFVEDSVRTITAPEQQQADSRNFNDYAPGRNPFLDSRLPLVADFQFSGQTITVVDNHFTSKGGSSPLFGQTQPTTGEFQEDPEINGSVDQRRAQARAVNSFVEDILADNPDANVVVEGDLNEFEFISPVDQILEDNLTNLTETLPPNDRYSFIFDGNSQALDHILVSDSLADSAEFDEVHVNTEFAQTDQRASDHDPSLARLSFADPANIQAGTEANETFVASPQRDVITAVGGNDTVIARYSELLQNDSIDGGANYDTFVLNNGTTSNSVTINVTLNDQLQGPDPDPQVTNFEVFNLTNFEGSATFTGGNQRDVFQGGAGDDTAQGNGGNDQLSGGGGSDLLGGGSGNDTYIVDSSDDQVSENLNAGTDLVRSYANFTLPANVENLTLLGNRTIEGTGNSLNNTLIGNSVSNILRGGTGADTLLGQAGNDQLVGNQGADVLMGGAGADRFRFNDEAEGIDMITDFSAAADRIDVSRTGFSADLAAGQPIDADQFRIGTRAADAEDRFIYTQRTGALFFDPDGQGGSAQAQFADLNASPNLTNNDIFVVA